MSAASPAVRLALHTWTLDTTPLSDAVLAAKTAGWDGIELRRLDFLRAAEAGRAPTWAAVARFTLSMISTVERFNQRGSPATSERT